MTRYGAHDSGAGRSFTTRDLGPVTLPPARLSGDEHIEITIPAPPPLTEEQLVARFEQLAREHAEVRYLEPGEAVELGDEVQLDILGYAGGRLIPFSLRSGFWMELTPQESLPGFAETLAGSAVGDSVSIELVLPDTYPVESLRGVRARFLVDLLAAREVTLPDTDSEAFLRQLGRGSTLEEVMDALAQELLEEQGDQQWLEAQNRVLETLASRLVVELSPALIDEELRRRWLAAEGEVLEEKDFSLEERQEAFEAWRNDAATRADVERRLCIALALKAVAERDGLKMEPNDVFGILDGHMEAHGLKASEVREALVDPLTAIPLHNLAWHLLTVQHVMDQAQVHFEGADA